MVIKNTENMPRPIRPCKGSKYDPIAEKMKKLKGGQFFYVKVPAKVDPYDFNNRLNAYLGRKTELVAPKGFKFVKVVQPDDHRIAVTCTNAK